MSLKNYLNKSFNKDYFKLLFKRHLGLSFIPLAVFFCLLFLFAILDIDIDALAFFLVPYAVAIVPLTALILFKSYTKKGDSAYLMSVPLTRTQLFVTTYLVGLVLIETSLLFMTMITFMGYGSDFIQAIIAFLSLGSIYYTFACLGCVMGGHTITQFINMGVICFGPLALYLLTKLSLMSLTFGNYTTPINDSLVMLICPLLSAAEFLSGNGWPYFWAHILLVIGVIALCIYLIKRRPIEQAGHGTMFQTVSQWIVKPVIYLNVVYLVFNICLYATLNQSHHYDTRYYLCVILLLVGVSLLVGILIAIWTSKNLKSLIQPKEIYYQIIMVILSCGFMFISLWQNDQTRLDSLKETVDVSVEVPLCYNNFWVEMPKKEVESYLEKINSNRSSFISGNDYYLYSDIDRSAEIYINNNQRYYFNLDEASSDTIEFMESVWKKIRENNKTLDNDYSSYLQYEGIYIDGAIYDVESIHQAIENTYQDDLTPNFLNQLIVSNDFYERLYDQDSWSHFIQNYYPMTFSSMDYFTWIDYVSKHSTTIFTVEQWNQVEAAVSFENGHITSKYLEDILDCVEIISIEPSEYWTIQKATEEQVMAQTYMVVSVLEDYDNGEMTLFEGSEIGLSLSFVVDKIDGVWQPTFTGVYY